MNGLAFLLVAVTLFAAPPAAAQNFPFGSILQQLAPSQQQDSGSCP